MNDCQINERKRKNENGLNENGTERNCDWSHFTISCRWMILGMRRRDREKEETFVDTISIWC